VDDELGIGEITHSIMVGSGVTAEMATRLFSIRSKAKEWLEKIPHDLDLVDARNVDYEHFAKLIDALQIRDVRLARLTKILHKKRPRFIPVIDSVVRGHYLNPNRLSAEQKCEMLNWSDGRVGITVLWLMQNDISNSFRELEDLRSRLGREGINLTLARLISHMLWCDGWGETSPVEERFQSRVIYR